MIRYAKPPMFSMRSVPRAKSRSKTARKRRPASSPCWPLSRQGFPRPARAGRNTKGTVTATVPTAHPTTGIATADGTMGKAISTAVSFAATRGTGARRESRLRPLLLIKISSCVIRCRSGLCRLLWRGRQPKAPKQGQHNGNGPYGKVNFEGDYR